MMHRTTLPLLVFGLALFGFALNSRAAAGESAPRGIPPATVVMEFPDEFGAIQRPAVEFDHAAHTKALEAEGCEKCHTVDDKGLTPVLTATLDVDDRDRLIDIFHDMCTSCHDQRAAGGLKAGPVTCGECHVRRPKGVSERAEMSFDYSLHARHAKAYPERCEDCHHVYDEEQQKLVYVKGKEDACGSCHGALDEEDKPSLENASHRGCISCHLKRKEAELETGPVRCVECHDLDHQLAIKKLDETEIPRLMRGQPDTVWIVDDEARTRVVAFDHQGHEPLTSSCSNCHHQTMKPCSECHSLIGSSEGGGITMLNAYHRDDSEHSCVGCHALKTQQQECAGCHAQPSVTPADSTCAVCHAGPVAGPEVAEMPVPAVVEVELAALPKISESYPETVEISSLVDQYKASKLPHAKIVARLDAAVRDSDLASRFHQDVETLCAGCHHHSPVGTRPPQCRACHAEAAATRDMPGLKVAYHRQCMGCHAVMGIKAQKCTDCHEERGGEDA